MIKEKTKKRGRPSKSELKRRRRAEGRDTVIKFLFYIGVALLLSIFIQELRSDEMVHKFKSPSFSGIGASAHYLTIENQEFNRKQALKAEIKALQDEIERDKENTTLARFIRNLESRIYSTLAKDISESLFDYSNPGTLENPVTGSIWLEGNKITWVNDGVNITLTVEEWLDGVLLSTTTISIPIGNFGGCFSDCGG